MSVDAKFRTVGSFDADPALARQIQELEDNTADAFDVVRSQAQPRLNPTQAKTSAYTADLDELVRVTGTFTLRFPVASAINAGRMIGVVVKSATVTVVCASGQVQGSTSDSLTVNGWYLYISDGTGWWRRG